MDSDWIWEALALGQEKTLHAAETDHFDWNSTHQYYGTTLIALILGKSCRTQDDKGVVWDFVTDTDEGRKRRLRLMRWLIDKGASPHVKAPAASTLERVWWRPKAEEKKTARVAIKGKSALGVVMTCTEVIGVMEQNWTAEMDFLGAAAEILASYRASGAGGAAAAPRVSVSEGVVETWERVLADTSSADVVVACRAGSEAPPVELRAHAPVLRAASPVLRAMLSSPFREGTSHRLDLDCEPSAVSLLLSLLYAGGTDEPPTAGAMASALELAHQWQAGHAVEMLTDALAASVEEGTFERRCEVAARLHLPRLLSACKAFAATSANLACGFREKRYSNAVQSVLAEVLESTDERRNKRRRMLL